MQDTIKINRKNTKMIAHRGLSSIERENTCAAFVAAGNRAAYYGIETDVHRTKDGKYIIHHDDVVMSEYNISKTDFDTLRTIVLPDRDNVPDRADLRLPSLQEYVRICKKYGKVGVLELKDHKMKSEHIQEIIDIIKEEDYLDRIVFISFCLENMKNVRELLPEQPAQWLRSDWQEEYFEDLLKYKLELDIGYYALTEDIIKRLHNSGRKVNIWTCDESEAAEKFIEMGVDFITTNCLE